MTERNRLITAGALLVMALLLVYSNHWHNSFHFDDDHAIVRNVFIQRLSNIPQFFKDATTFSILPVNRSYRPVLTTTLAIDYALASKFAGDGLDTFWYHVSTFGFFLLQGGLLFFFVRRILEIVAEGDDAPASNSHKAKKLPKVAGSAAEFNTASWMAFFTVAIYMLHPAAAETINYIIQRGDSLSTFFVILGFVMYQFYPGARKYYLYLIPVAIGSLTKPTALMFAPLLLCYDILFEQKRSLLEFGWLRSRTFRTAVIPSLMLAIALYFLGRHMEAGQFQPGGVSFYRYVITQPYVIMHYVTNFFVPLHFSADSDWGPFESILDARSLMGFVFLGLLIAAVFYSSKFARWRPLSFGVAWFLIALIPTSFVPLAEVTNDHRVFFPYVGLSLAAVWTLYLILQPRIQRSARPLVAVGVLAVLCGFSYKTHERNAVWHSEETLWRDVTIESPKNGRGHMNYGLIFMARASYDTANAEFTKGLECWPYYARLHLNMGILKNAMGDPAAAEQSFARAIQLMPDLAENYYYYARYLDQRGRKDQAMENLRKCIQLVDANMDARHALMPLLYDASRTAELKQVASRTLELEPGDPEATKYLGLAQSGKMPLESIVARSAGFTKPGEFLDLSLQYYRAGEYAQCIAACQRALKLKPDYAEAWSNICAAYNMLGNFEEGKRAGEEAVRYAPDNAMAKANLAWSVGELEKKK